MSSTNAISMLKFHQHLLQPLLVVLFICQLQALQIPKDVEILDGYEFDDSSEYYPTDANYYEARSLLSGLHKSIRNRRSTLAYDNAKKSTAPSGPAFSSDTPAPDAKRDASDASERTEQSVGRQQIKVSARNLRRMDKSHPEQLPRAEQQIMDPDYDYYSQRRISTWPDIYTTGPGDDRAVSASSDDGDTQAEASTNFLSRGRQARVNFVTQPKKEESSITKELPEPMVAKVPLRKASFHDNKYGLALPSYNYEMYPSRSYDPYLRRYDRFDEQYLRFDPYSYEDHYLHRRHYDPYDSYSPRIPQYPEPYYNYPDRRYDIPEPRDYSSALHNNEIYDKTFYPEAKSTSVYPSIKYSGYSVNPSSKYPNYPRNQRRIVYYAHLPEIVRTPYDFPYRYNSDRYDATLTAGGASDGSNSYKVDKAISGGDSANAAGSDGIAGAAGDGADHAYDYAKRDKKDYGTPKPNKLNPSSRQ